MKEGTGSIARHVQLRLAEVSDADFVLSLRLQGERSRFLSPVRDDIAAQREWLLHYKEREKKKQEYYYVILGDRSEKLGLVRLYDFQGDSFSWGSWILTSKAPAYAAIESALAVYEIGFHRLGFERSHFEARKENANVIAFHKSFGAVVRKEDELNYYFEITKETYEETRRKYRRFLEDA